MMFMRRWWFIILAFALGLPLVSAAEYSFFSNINIGNIFRWLYEFFQQLFSDPKSRTIILAIMIFIILYNVLATALGKTPLSGPHMKKVAFALAFISTLALFFGPRTRDIILQFSYVFIWVLIGVLMLRMISKLLDKVHGGSSYGYGSTWGGGHRGYNPVAGDGKKRKKVLKNEFEDARKEEKEEKDEFRTERKEERTIKHEIKDTNHAIELLNKIKQDLEWLLPFIESALQGRQITESDLHEAKKIQQDIHGRLEGIKKYMEKERKELFVREKKEITQEWEYTEAEEKNLRDIELLVNSDLKLEEKVRISGELASKQENELTDQERTILKQEDKIEARKRECEKQKLDFWKLAVKRFHQAINAINYLNAPSPSEGTTPQHTYDRYRVMAGVVAKLIEYLENYQKLQKHRVLLEKNIENIEKIQAKHTRRTESDEKEEAKDLEKDAREEDALSGLATKL
jgi:hypothetical protein